MFIRKTEQCDVEAVLELYAGARAFMREQGNNFQWINNYPSLKELQADMERGVSYVCVEESPEDHAADVSGAPSGGRIVGTFAYIYGEDPDPNYAVIYDGAWPDRLPYGVVHRITTLRGTRGVGAFCLNWAYEQCHHLRIDTHRANIPMQNLVRKCGFSYCGVVKMITGDGTDRDAFIKI